MMLRSIFKILCTLAMLSAPVENVWAQGADQAAFVKNLVEAINSKSLERRKALLHPKSIGCLSGEAGSIYEEIFARQSKTQIPANYQWKMTSIPPGQPLLFADMFEYPARPTHLLQLDFETGAMILQIIHDGNQWWEIEGCLKPETISAARNAKQSRAARTEKAGALAAGIAPQLKEKIVELFKEGRRIEAYKEYAKVTGVDLATAKEVVNLLTTQAK